MMFSAIGWGVSRLRCSQRMRELDGQRIYSATDLVNFLACPHLTGLQMGRLEGRVEEPPPRAASTAGLAARKGDEYERSYLEQMRAVHGEQLVEIEGGARAEDLLGAAAATRAAMAAGAPLIYQASFLDQPWMGYADFLKRVEQPSDLGGWSYEALDTKLARSAKPYFIVQLCLYAELIAAVQGSVPPSMGLILGDGTHHSFAFEEFGAYFRRMKERFLGVVEAGIDDTYPEPVDHCEVCDWQVPCQERRLADDHLSLVAKLGRVQAAKLRPAGIETVAELAVAGPTQRPASMATDTFERLQSQAALQVAERESGERRLELLEPQEAGTGPPRGFALLPEPSDGDLFFDIEGDPFYDEGLEYLWGVTYLEDGEPTFRAFWGLDPTQEKAAFEAFVDFVFERRERYPGMHVYHYAPYERTALAKMMGRHASREEEVDRLLRERVLVDLYRVVEQSMRISRPSYSLKEVEHFYDQDRAADVKQAGDSVLLFEQWREDEDPETLGKIEAYNKEDCDSTLRLREWLIEQRALCEAQYEVTIPWRTVGEPEEKEDGKEDVGALTAELQSQLLDGVPDDPARRTAEQADRWLLAQLLDYHRREAKPGYWQFFERLERSDAELTELDSEALAGMQRSGDPEPLPKPARSSLQRFTFPTQEHKVGPGEFCDPHSCGIDPVSGESDMNPKQVEVVEMDDRGGTLVLKLSRARLAETQTALIPGAPYSTPLQRQALRDFAAEAIAAGLDGIAGFQAGRDILRRGGPRTAALAPGEPLQGERAEIDQIKEIARSLQNSCLFVQGPPGSGKTYTGAQVIVDLIASGQRVGVTSNSHKAINNLLGEVEAAAHAAELPLRGLKKSGGGEQDYKPRPTNPQSGQEPLIGNSDKSADFAPGDQLQLIAGTAWLWCREEMRNSVDCIVIDEAGQISLADAIAISTAARNVVLLGDPLQLAQVSQGTHPPGSGASVLEHLLGEHGTIPPHLGIFLEQTRRMHPDVTEYVSQAIYQGRLRSEPSCKHQRIDAEGELSGTGVRSIAVPHTGNSRQSPEEAERIVAEIKGLDDARYTDKKGEQSALERRQIMVVTPYNAQVRCLQEHLAEAGMDEVAVGTVDKFQGQEAAVVFFSMATSSAAEMPRNVEFLYSRNRLNVAVSRAQCLAVLVASPALLTIPCHTVEQMRLVNALCLLDEMG